MKDIADHIFTRKPYKPAPYRDCCTITKPEYDEPYNKNGFTGIKTFVDYITPKGKQVTKYFLRIKWL